MAHGYNNFMNNKDFHPANFTNQKRIWEAEQRKAQEEKKQEELRAQYLKEQEIYRSKELLGKANPLDFMYDPPPGYVKEDELDSKADEGKLELKFEWQKPGRSAPREAIAREMEVRDKPFGVAVRNVKCIKCGKWGHINTDRECPLFGMIKPSLIGKSTTEEEEGETSAQPVQSATDDGLSFRQCVRDRVVDSRAHNQQILASDDETELHDLLATMDSREKKKVLRKLARIEAENPTDDKETKTKKKKSKKSKRKAKEKKDRRREKERRATKRRRHDSTTSSESDSDSSRDVSPEPVKKSRKRKKHKSEKSSKSRGKRKYSDSGSEESDSDHQSRRRRERRRRYSNADH